MASVTRHFWWWIPFHIIIYFFEKVVQIMCCRTKRRTRMRTCTKFKRPSFMGGLIICWSLFNPWTVFRGPFVPGKPKRVIFCQNVTYTEKQVFQNKRKNASYVSILFFFFWNLHFCVFQTHVAVFLIIFSVYYLSQKCVFYFFSVYSWI